MHRAVIIFITLLLLAGCKTQIIGLQQDPSFTRDSLTQQTILAGGVVSMLPPKDTIVERVRKGDILHRAFHAERRDLQLLSAGQMVNKLGYEAFMKIHDDYQVTGTLHASDAEALQQLFPDSHYLILCRIEKNQTSKNRNQRESDLADSAEDLKENKYEYI